MFKSSTVTFGNNSSDNYIKVNGRYLQMAVKELEESINKIIERETEKLHKNEELRLHSFDSTIAILQDCGGEFSEFCKKYAREEDHDKKVKESWFKKAKYDDFRLVHAFYEFMSEKFPNFDGNYYPDIYKTINYGDLLDLNTTKEIDYFYETLKTFRPMKRNLEDVEQIRLAKKALKDLTPFKNVTAQTLFMNLRDYNRVYKKGMITQAEGEE